MYKPLNEDPEQIDLSKEQLSEIRSEIIKDFWEWYFGEDKCLFKDMIDKYLEEKREK